MNVIGHDHVVPDTPEIRSKPNFSTHAMPVGTRQHGSSIFRAYIDLQDDRLIEAFKRRGMNGPPTVGQLVLAGSHTRSIRTRLAYVDAQVRDVCISDWRDDLPPTLHYGVTRRVVPFLIGTMFGRDRARPSMGVCKRIWRDDLCVVPFLVRIMFGRDPP